jgi:SAM-dependent methyltransferase
MSVLVRLLYALYLRLFGGKSSPYHVSERIVEYPFAVRALRELPGGSRVAVFGCHGDLLTTLLPSLGYHVFGIDIKDFPQRFGDFEFHREDVRHTSFKDAFFDAVVAISTIEHVGLFDNDASGDAGTINEMRRVLKPGGILAITVPFASRSAVLPLFERIYDKALLTSLLDGLDVESICAYALLPGSLWSPITLDDAPEPSRRTECTALVLARKPVSNSSKRNKG